MRSLYIFRLFIYSAGKCVTETYQGLASRRGLFLNLCNFRPIRQAQYVTKCIDHVFIKPGMTKDLRHWLGRDKNLKRSGYLKDLWPLSSLCLKAFNGYTSSRIEPLGFSKSLNFSSLLSAVVSQRFSVQVARTILAKTVRLYDRIEPQTILTLIVGAHSGPGAIGIGFVEHPLM
jgi:hypothetical protein